MHSSELPVTEWWDPDPEWEVYDVPGSPESVPHEIWWAAYQHLWVLEWITTGSAWYSPHPWQHQIEPPRPPYLGRWPWPCSCAYAYLCCGLIVDTFEAVQFLREFGYAVGHSATGFIIHSDCPQHGDDAHA